MSAESLPEQRTEMPTERRMGELRKEGALFHSQDLEHVLTIAAGFYMISYMWSNLYSDMKYVMIRSFTMIGERQAFETADLANGFLRLLMLLMPDLGLTFLVVGSVAVLSVMLQTNWNRRDKWIKFRWDFLNPVGGLFRIISIMGFVNFLKALFKLMLILPIGYMALKTLAPKMVMLIHTSIPSVMDLTGRSITYAFWKVMYVFIAFAVFDWTWGRYQWLKRNKMTKEEVKDERKALEGDETTKRKIIAKGMQRLAQRLKQTVPKADVIITNPTHYAVALRYDRGQHAAPVVVAKGTDFIAARIREIAKEHKIPILERKALARALYASTEVGSEIPRDLFRAVAEVLAYVYKLKNPHRQSGARK